MQCSNEAGKNNFIDENFIFQRCQDLLFQANIKNAPVEPKILASFRDIKRIIEKDMVEAGILIPLKNGGAEIYLRKKDNVRRKNFTCCHEITHTLFPDYQLEPQKRSDLETGQFNTNNYTEYLCDYGASELLMPTFLFKKIFAKLNFSINSLIAISNKFNSSLEATAIKIVKQDEENCAVVVWEEIYKPAEFININSTPLPGFEHYKPRKQLRIRFAYGFKKEYYMPTFKSLKEDRGVISKSLIENTKKSGIECLDFGNFKIKCEVHTLPIISRNSKRVLSLLKIE